MSKEVQQLTECTAPLASSVRTEVGGRSQDAKGAKGRRKGRKERESPSSFFATFAFFFASFASKKLLLIRKNVKQAQPELWLSFLANQDTI